MNGTNVDFYVAGFDDTGKRVGCLICEFNPNKEKNADKLAALKEEAKEKFTEATVIDVITAEEFNLYINGSYVRDQRTGRPIKYVAPEPTAEEKAAAEKASLSAEYEANKKDMLNALQVATLAGNSDAVASIQQDYQDMTAAYRDAVEGVTE